MPNELADPRGAVPRLVPPNGPVLTKQELIQKTIAVWEPRLQRRISEDEARQIIERVVGAFRLLRKWDVEDKRRNARAQGEGPKKSP